MQGDREERIRRRAYEIWEREGQPEGRGEAHWAQACAEIDSEDAARAPGSVIEKAVDAGTGVVKKVVRRTRKAATEALGAGLNAVVDVVEEALAPKQPRARKAKGDAGRDTGPAEPGAVEEAESKASGKSQLPVAGTGSRAVAKTEDMDCAPKAAKPARGKVGKSVAPEKDRPGRDKPEAAAKPRRKSAAGQNTEAAH